MKCAPFIAGLALPLALAVGALAPVGDDDETPAVEKPAAESPADVATFAAVERLMAAFNAHDVEALLACVTEDIGWYYVQDDVVTPEAQDKAALRQAMTGYFKAIPSARASFDDSMVSGSYVTVRERAFYERDGEELSQSSLAVYLVRDGLVARVWYYPVEG